MTGDQCQQCIYFWGIDACFAFPEGIPPKVLSGVTDHSQPLKGDNGIRFTQISDDEEENQKNLDSLGNKV